MKKILVVVVLSLLFFNINNALADSSYFRNAADKASKLNSKIIQRDLMKHSFFTGFDYAGAANSCASRKMFYFHFQGTTDAERANKFGMYYKIPLNQKVIYCSKENLQEDPVHGRKIPSNIVKGSSYSMNNILASTNYNDQQKTAWYGGQTKSVEDNKDMLTNIKQTCKAFGYRDGTEKLADCMKELFLKQSSSNTTTTQGTTTVIKSKTKRKIDPSVWDDLLSIAGVGSSSSSSSSSSLSKPKGTCYFTGEETVGHNKSCRYSCTGSIDTITIAAMENCPLHIQR